MNSHQSFVINLLTNIDQNQPPESMYNEKTKRPFKADNKIDLDH